MEIERPNTLDFMKALELLYPYKGQLELIKKAEQNDEFDTIEITDPWSAITYFRESQAYINYDVKNVSHSIYDSVKTLKQYTYDSDTYERIHKLKSTELTTNYVTWKLSDVYYYLQMLFEDVWFENHQVDEIVIENSIIQGEILGIIDCFLIRI